MTWNQRYWLIAVGISAVAGAVTSVWNPVAGIVCGLVLLAGLSFGKREVDTFWPSRRGSDWRTIAEALRGKNAPKPRERKDA